jgi:hypothetical protein
MNHSHEVPVTARSAWEAARQSHLEVQYAVVLREVHVKCVASPLVRGKALALLGALRDGPEIEKAAG